MEPSRLPSGLGSAAAVALAHVAAVVGLAGWERSVAPSEVAHLEASMVPDPATASDESPSPLPQRQATSVASTQPGPAAPTEPSNEAPSEPASIPIDEGIGTAETGPRAAPSAMEGTPGEGSGSTSQGDGDGSSEPTDYLSNPAPNYPLASRLLGEEGRVLLRVLVDTAGNSRAVVLHQSSGHSRLDGSALAAVWSWRFHPARRAGRVLEAWVIVPIRFSIKGAS